MTRSCASRSPTRSTTPARSCATIAKRGTPCGSASRRRPRASSSGTTADCSRSSKLAGLVRSPKTCCGRSTSCPGWSPLMTRSAAADLAVGRSRPPHPPSAARLDPGPDGRRDDRAAGRVRGADPLLPRPRGGLSGPPLAARAGRGRSRPLAAGADRVPRQATSSRERMPARPRDRVGPSGDRRRVDISRVRRTVRGRTGTRSRRRGRCSLRSGRRCPRRCGGVG